jgi:tetratricopeptide (TPR) repeat protein
MKHMKLRLALAASAAALIAGCTTGQGIGISGGGGCSTIFVYKPGTGGAPGGVQPVSNCGSSGLPREQLVAPAAVAAPRLASEARSAATTEGPVVEHLAGPTVSPAAEATRPHFPAAEPYAAPRQMIEAADMAAFMGKARADYAARQNPAGWSFVILDAMAAGDTALAQDVLDAISSRPPSEIMSATHMRPWVLAAAGRKEAAVTAAGQLRTVMPPFMVRGHRALLAEGMGDVAGALAIYAEGPRQLVAPNPAQAGSPDYFMRSLTFAADRLLAVREAELLRTAGRDADARAVFTAILAADPDDAYVTARLAAMSQNRDKRPARTLNQAFAVALNDEAGIVEQQSMLLGLSAAARGQRAPFNPLLSSMRQAALLLDPDNGEVRISEVGHLYATGHFDSALRMAQQGNPSSETKAALYSAAASAALELGSPEAMSGLIDQALAIDHSPGARIAAASTLANANVTPKAIQILDQALRDPSLSPGERIGGLVTRAQAHFNGGDINGAVTDARAAVAIDDNDGTQGFLASMLVKSTPQRRQEGLGIMRQMMVVSPGDTGQMNNLGYSLIDGHATDQELDEGYRMLKEAARITPDEPNLLDSLGWAYYQYGDFREAERYLRLALQAYEPFAHWELHDHMGDIQWRLGNQDRARTEWQASLDARPPGHEQADIRAKLASGLATPAPARRETPEVPLSRRTESNDI